jgi:hypothetical protein
VIRKDNGSNNSLFLGLSDGAFFMIKHIPLPNGNHPILSPVCPMGIADTLEQSHVPHIKIKTNLSYTWQPCFLQASKI